MIRVFACSVLAMLAARPALAEPIRLQPDSTWHVNYAEDSCRLARVFGKEDNRVVLTMDRFAPGDPFQLVVASKLLSRVKATTGPKRQVTLRFGPGEAEQSEDMRPIDFQGMPGLMASGVMLGSVIDEEKHRAETAAAKAAGDKKKLRMLEVLTPVMPMTPAREAAVTYLEIGGASRDRVVLETGPMDRPMAALRSCTDDLLTQWGVDVAAHKTLTRPVAPKGNPQFWVTSDDYPNSQLISGTQGLIQFRLSIDEEGRVSDCHIQQSTRPAEFDRTVCRIMTTRARFEPALDAAGKPIASYWRSSFSFQM